MKFGVREICEVVLKAKATQKIGNKIFYANEPVIYFDTLKTSSLEGAATTVYAQGGRGNSRLVAWEGERTLTFNMQDALISPEGFMILSGAGLIEASRDNTIKQHVTEIVDARDVKVTEEDATIKLSQKPYLPVDKGENFAYVMFMKNGEIISEPFIPEHAEIEAGEDGKFEIKVLQHDIYNTVEEDQYALLASENAPYKGAVPTVQEFDSVMVDYYVEHESDAQQIEITADKFGGNYYLEASTLFRNTNGVDMPAEFIIPNCKIQSNFTFTMASSGDPSVFDFVLDAFPDYTRFDHSKKVLAAIQIIRSDKATDLYRKSTHHDPADEVHFD